MSYVTTFPNATKELTKKRIQMGHGENEHERYQLLQSVAVYENRQKLATPQQF